MKSIMEEASSITKAIENAWNRAGQPLEFSVKILEHPKTSFFGLKTAKSAKIAFFFNELTVKPKEYPQQKQLRPLTPRPQQQPRTGEREDQRGQQPRRPQHGQQRPERPQQDSRQAQKPEPRQDRHPDNRPAERPAPRQQPHDENRRYGQRQEQRPERQPDTRQHAPRPERYDQRPERSMESQETWTPEMVDAAQDWIKETLVMTGKPDISITPYVSHNYLKLTLSQPVMHDMRQEETQLKSWGSLAMEAVREKMHKPLRNLRIILESKK